MELFDFDSETEREGKITVWALAWFPKDEWAKAIAKWPHLLDVAPEDHELYSRTVEANLKAAAAKEPGSPDVAPLNVDDLVAEYGDEGGDARFRGTMGANVARGGGAISWPPTRNDTCWCQSGRKYKTCCGPEPAAG